MVTVARLAVIVSQDAALSNTADMLLLCQGPILALCHMSFRIAMRGGGPVTICPVLLSSPELGDIVWKGDIVALDKLLLIQHRPMSLAQCGPIRRRLATIELTPTLAAPHLKLWPVGLLHLAAFALYTKLHALCVPIKEPVDLDIFDTTKRCQTL